MRSIFAPSNRPALEERREMPASSGAPNMTDLLEIVPVWNSASTAVGADGD
jgi:hypothetical protein